MMHLARHKLFWLLPVVLFTLSCAGFRVPDDGRIEEARSLLGEFGRKNRSMPSFKGIGELRIRRNQESWSVRMAWLGASGGRLRVEALALTGQSFAKLVCDRSDCYFLFRDDSGEHRREKSGTRTVEPLTGISVDVDALVLMLGGGVPIADHDAAWMQAGEGDNGDVVVLRDRWRGVVQKIYLTADGSGIRQIKRFGVTGLRYSAEISRLQMTDGRRMPYAVQIRDKDGNFMAISVQRCWADIDLPEDVFDPGLPEN
ncbi:MAG: hypothetical protein ACQERN_01900 [Thermodesulfobacteriota bacterium]